jgi:hypothetical protein
VNSAFSTLTILQRFSFAILSADSAVTTAIGGAGRIHPNVSPSGISTRHLVHSDYGGAQVSKSQGAAIGMVSMRWAFTAWEPSYSQQALEPLMQAVMTVLIGADTRGKTHRYLDDSRVWSIYADYFGPDIVELEVAPAGTWAPVREVYTMSLQQVA